MYKTQSHSMFERSYQSFLFLSLHNSNQWLRSGLSKRGLLIGINFLKSLSKVAKSVWMDFFLLGL